MKTVNLATVDLTTLAGFEIVAAFRTIFTVRYKTSARMRSQHARFMAAYEALKGTRHSVQLRRLH